MFLVEKKSSFALLSISSDLGQVFGQKGKKLVGKVSMGPPEERPG